MEECIGITSHFKKVTSFLHPYNSNNIPFRCDLKDKGVVFEFYNVGRNTYIYREREFAN